MTQNVRGTRVAVRSQSAASPRPQLDAVESGERASKDRAREIAAAALRLFAERDFASVTIKEIAQAIDINSALIYYYFKNKDDLFHFAVESAIRQALENYRFIAQPRTSPEEIISAWFNNNLQLSGTISDLLKIMLDYAKSRRNVPSIDALIRQFYGEECRILAGAIDQGIGARRFRNVDSARLALFVSSHLDGIIVASIIRPDFDLKTAFEDLRTLLWDHLGVNRLQEKRPG